MSTGFLLEVIKCFKTGYGDGCTTNSEHTKNNQTVHFKLVNGMVYELYLNKAVIKQTKDHKNYSEERITKTQNLSRLQSCNLGERQ